MTSNHETAKPLAELAHLLDVWGGEPSRWPPRVRLRIAALATAGPEARRLLDEASALDRIIDRAANAPAPKAEPALRSLADRIAAAAAETTRPAATATPASGNVVQLPARAARTAAPAAARWQAAGLMAASLLTGIYLGGNFNLAPVLQELAEVAGLATVVDPTLGAIGDELGEEDLL